MRWVIWITALVAPVFAAASSEGGMAEIDDAIRAQAARDGIVRVIVEVAPSEGSGSVATASETRGHCENADCAKLQVRAAMEGDGAPVIEDLGETMLLMEVTPEGLERLRDIPFVTRVSADVATPLPPEPEPDGRSREGPPDLDAPQTE
jgi:hypothetical protein